LGAFGELYPELEDHLSRILSREIISISLESNQSQIKKEM
jgi:hypothetical protein